MAIYALEHLGEKVPVNVPNTFYSNMLRNTANRIDNELSLALMIDKNSILRLTPEQITRLEKAWGHRAEGRANLVEIARHLQEADLSTLRKRLCDDNPAVRDLAIQTIARKRLPLEDELIAQLNDPKLYYTAHEALVRLARGTDFGPSPNASQQDRRRSIARWRKWLALQQVARNESAAKNPSRVDLIPTDK